MCLGFLKSHCWCIIFCYSKYQKSYELLIPKRSFQRLCREIFQKIDPTLKIQSAALLALQEASEAYLVELFTDSQIAALHGQRITIKSEDIEGSISN